MALSLSGERSIAAATPVRPFRAIAAWIARALAARNRRIALERLLDLDASRLLDLGITRADIVDAMARRNGQTSGMILNAARARAARR